MSRNSGAAATAGLIGIAKWVLVFVLSLAGVISGLTVILTSDGEAWAGLMGIGILFATAVNALVTYVVFGWFQHTLGALVSIAENTAPQARPNAVTSQSVTAER